MNAKGIIGYEISAEEIDRAGAETERQEAEAAKAQSRAEERTRIIAKYPYLTQYDYSGKASSYAVGAKNMRKELERAFPGVKFS